MLPRGMFFTGWCMIVLVSFFGFTSYTYNKAFSAVPPIPSEPVVKGTYTKKIKCVDQKEVSAYLKQQKYRILFNFTSPDGKLMKIIAANQRGHAILFHIIDSESACVIDELGEGTYAPKLFFDLFRMIPDNFKKRGKKL